MLKNILCLVVMIMFISFNLNSQVAISNDGSSPDASAMLEVKSSDKGILIPRVTEAQRNTISSPATGLLVYQTDNTNGFYYYDGTSWISVGAGVLGIDDLTDGKTGGNSVFLGNSAGSSDDGTSNNNTAVGYESMKSNTTGNENSALGYHSLYSNSWGYRNTAIGYESLKSNTGGTYNTAVGYQALLNNTHGSICAFGYQSLKSNTIGSGNNAFGYLSLSNNTTGSHNTAIGFSALQDNNAFDNTAVGYLALKGNTSGGENTAIGSSSMKVNTTGGRNTALGFETLQANQGGERNIAIGYQALRLNVSGNYNIAIGTQSMTSNVASGNTALGYKALESNSNGTGNVGLGYETNSYNQTGSYNTIIGYQAGKGNSYHNKSYNVFLGYQAGYNETGDNKLYISNSNTTSPLIYGEFDNSILAVNGKLGVGETNPGHKVHIVTDASSEQGLMVTQNGTGNASAGTFEVSDASSSGHALNVYNSGSGFGMDLVIHSSGTGPGGRFTIDNPTNDQPAIYGEHNGLGNTAYLTSTNTSNNSSTLYVNNGGNGYAGEFLNNNSSNNHATLQVGTGGTRQAGYFYTTNTSNNYATLYAKHNGIGNAGRFEINNSASSAITLFSKTNGTGPAFGANNTGDGIAGFFNIIGASNSNTALEIKTQGTGSAGKFEVDNTGNSDPVLLITGNGTGPSISTDGTIHMTGFSLPTSANAGYVLTSDASGIGTWQVSSFDYHNGGEAGGADRSLGNTDNYAFSIKTNNTNRLKIFNDGGIRIDGHVGIFTDPESASSINKSINLYASDTYSNPHLKISGHNSGYIELISRRVAATSGKSWKIGSGSGSSTDLDRFYIYNPDDGYCFTIRDGGKIGIGTTTPDEKLHIAGNMRLNGTFEDKDGEAGTSGQILSSTASGTDWIAVPNNGDFSDGGEAGGADRSLGNTDNFALGFITNNTNRLQITNDGDIGLGTTTPNGQFEVYQNNLGGVTAGDFVVDTDNKTVYVGRLSSVPYNSSDFVVRNRLGYQTFVVSNTNYISLGNYNGANEQMRVVFDGNTFGVGIGTTTPDTKLDINGVVTIQEVLSTPANPDADGETRVYIKDNKYIIQYNDGGTIKYRYMDLTSTDASWSYTTTAP